MVLNSDIFGYCLLIPTNIFAQYQNNYTQQNIYLLIVYYK